MAVLDIVLILLFIPGIIKGVSKGFIEQLVDIVAIVAGAWAAFRFSSILSSWLETYIALDGRLIRIICFIIIIILAALILHLLGSLIVKALNAIKLGWINRLAGFLFGILKTALILGLVVSVFDNVNTKWNLVEKEKYSDSVMYSALKDFSDTVFPYIEDLAKSEKVKVAGESVKKVVENV